ncbi:uncharacterized protein LOC114532029 [Dendronephthya gigantea]|uniref:uncharacterized protein LOC114532029 n=1 Tax=Dendronephthya gigantea TaxID=151771 RepID=UPI00106C4140|nr:uncharacterized protein LOC114532029 [Dendronephthya gigantea]
MVILDEKEGSRKGDNVELINPWRRHKEREVALNPDKLKLRMEEVAFVGHILTRQLQGIKIGPEKVKTITEVEPPTYMEELQRLNEIVNYLAKLLPQFATIMEPVCKLTRKDVPKSGLINSNKHSTPLRSWQQNPHYFAIMFLIKSSKTSAMQANEV